MPRPRPFPLVFLLACALVGVADARRAHAAEPRLENGDFARWQEGLPAGWTRADGAHRDPADTPSEIGKAEGGGVALHGNAATNRWSMLLQGVEAKPGDFLELRYRARALDLKREPGQFGSCYVGFVLRGAAGGVAGFQIADVRSEAWQDGAVRLRVPAEAARVEVALFLSQSGRLEVRSLALRALTPADAYDVLVAEMDRHYSYFHLHGIDWKTLAKAGAEAARAAKTPEAFIQAIRPLLHMLQDGHVWIEAPDGARIWTWAPPVETNFDVQVIARRLTDVKKVARNVLSGRTPEGFGYLAIGTLQLDDAQYTAVEKALRAHFDTPGIILDLRVNGGGREALGQRLCGLLADTRVRYASAAMRSGPAHDDLQPAGDRHVEPAAGARYAGPVVGLIGPGCVSSGEGMAMMLKALPGVPLVGLPTRGSSGNPQPVALPNGVTVWFSRWVSMLPDGTPIERRGVLPDVAVEHVPGEDRTLDEAVKILKAKAGKR